MATRFASVHRFAYMWQVLEHGGHQKELLWISACIPRFRSFESLLQESNGASPSRDDLLSGALQARCTRVTAIKSIKDCQPTQFHKMHFFSFGLLQKGLTSMHSEAQVKEDSVNGELSFEQCVCFHAASEMMGGGQLLLRSGIAQFCQWPPHSIQHHSDAIFFSEGGHSSALRSVQRCVCVFS